MTASASAQSSTSLFRRLTWQSTVPLEIRLAEGEPGAGSGADKYYVCASFFLTSPLLKTKDITLSLT